MSIPQKRYYTAEDYWNLPQEERAELIDGKLYYMAPPNRRHQKLVAQLTKILGQYIDLHHGECEIYPAPFAVNLDAENKNWVEPDISVICDKRKLDDRGCTGAPDFIIEIVSSSSRRMDYTIKNFLYSNAGVREYWIIDPLKECTTVYRYEEDAAPTIFPFESDITVGIYQTLSVNVSSLLKEE